MKSQITSYLTLSVLAAFGSLPTTDAASTPPKNCCYLYESKDFLGKSTEVCLKEGREQTVIKLRDHQGGWHDRVSSWKCGDDLEHWFCLGDQDCLQHPDRVIGHGQGIL